MTRPWGRTPDPPGVVLPYAPGRGRFHALRLLEGYRASSMRWHGEVYKTMTREGDALDALSGTLILLVASAERPVCEIEREACYGHRLPVPGALSSASPKLYAVEKST